MRRICFCIAGLVFLATTVARGINYEVWAGNDDLLDIHLAYYNVDEYDYVKLGRTSGEATFYGDYQYYVVVVTNQLHLDAVQGSDGAFYGEADSAHLVTGNVTDWDNVLGPTNYQYAVLGGEGPENFSSYFRFTNPGTWTSITVYALDEMLFNPLLRVNRYGNWIWSEGWPPWATVEITIGDPGHPDVTAVVQADGDGNWWFDPDGDDYFIRAGDLITADDGTYYREMTVADLRVTGADPGNNTLSGMGVPNAFVQVTVGDVTVEALADNHGAWTADLGAEGINVDQGTRGYVFVHDQNGHHTQSFWRYATLNVEEIALIWVTWDGLSPFYILEIMGDGILGARFQAPSGQWYDLHSDDWELSAVAVIDADAVGLSQVT